MLADLLRRFPGAVEADLQHYYGIDLADLYRGDLTPRRLAILVEYMPRGAVIWQMTGGPAAITSEVEALWGVHFLQEAQMYQASGNKGEEPTMRQYPEGVEAKLAADKAIEAKAQRWREGRDKFRR